MIAPANSFVGRQRELETLIAAMADAMAGHGRRDENGGPDSHRQETPPREYVAGELKKVEPARSNDQRLTFSFRATAVRKR